MYPFLRRIPDPEVSGRGIGTRYRDEVSGRSIGTKYRDEVSGRSLGRTGDGLHPASGGKRAANCATNEKRIQLVYPFLWRIPDPEVSGEPVTACIPPAAGSALPTALQTKKGYNWCILFCGEYRIPKYRENR